MKKIGVIGTRQRNIRTDYQLVHDAFFEIYEEGDWLVSGGCPKGGDAFAEKIAFGYGIPILLFPPKKKTREEFFARNTLVAEHSDIIIACVVRPHESIDDILSRSSGGTEDTIKKFMKKQGYMPFHLKRNIPVPDYMKGEIIIV
jgi:hypothetical protein